MHCLAPLTILFVLLPCQFEVVTTQVHDCIAVWYYASQCQGFGYQTTHNNLGTLPSAFIENVARKLGEKGRTADPAILPFLCYAFVPKCRPKGNITHIRPCKEACTKLEGMIGDAISEAAGGMKTGQVCEALSLANKGEERCVSYRKLKRYGEANPEWKRRNLSKSERNATTFEHILEPTGKLPLATTTSQAQTTTIRTTKSSPTTQRVTTTPEPTTTRRPNVFKINGVETSLQDLIDSGVDVEGLFGDAFGSLGSAFNTDSQ